MRSWRASVAVSGLSGVFTSAFTSGSSRGSTAEPLSTDATTVAIAIGEASTVPWPIMLAAACVSLPGVPTSPKNDGNPVSWSTPKPRAAAAEASDVAPSLACWETNAVLQELASAVSSVIRPSPEPG